MADRCGCAARGVRVSRLDGGSHERDAVVRGGLGRLLSRLVHWLGHALDQSVARSGFQVPPAAEREAAADGAARQVMTFDSVLILLFSIAWSYLLSVIAIEIKNEFVRIV